MYIRNLQLNTILDWIRSAPATDEQDCESTDWFDELYDWAHRVATNTGCPPETSHVFGCDKCYNCFDFIVRTIEWGNTDEGARHNREAKHWSWHNLIERGAPLQPRTDILHEGDRDWMVIGRQTQPVSAPVP
jgi:hypothetical protein